MFLNQLVDHGALLRSILVFNRSVEHKEEGCGG